MSPINSLFIILVFFILSVTLVLILYFLSVWPFNYIYKPYDPRTWKRANDKFEWLIPEFDYRPYKNDEPRPEINDIYQAFQREYCSWSGADPKLCK